MTADAFNSLVCVHLDTMYRVALALCGNTDDASDAVQDAAIKLWTHADRLSDVADIRAYSIAAARNAALSLIASRKKAEPLNATYPLPDSTSTDRITDSADAVRRVLALSQQLPENQRTVLVMRDFEGCEIDEIEHATGLSAVNIRVLLSRARATIRKYFDR